MGSSHSTKQTDNHTPNIHLSDGIPKILARCIASTRISEKKDKSVKGSTLKVMTFNILSEKWIHLSHLAGQDLKQRLFDICYVITHQSPDIVLLQECSKNMFDMIKKDKENI